MARRASDMKLESGRAALARGEWRVAREAFTVALEDRESASALEGLSESLWWLEEVQESLRLRERAFTMWRDKGERARAARAALWLAREHASGGDAAAANDWLQRAERLSADAAPCVEAGWVEMAHAKLAPDAEAAAEHAQRAHECAVALGDHDLQFDALSEYGRALVMNGQVDQGMALLDEAVAAATGGQMQGIHAIGDTCCNMIVACDRAVDLERAAQWCRVVDEFARRHHHVPLFASCQTVYGGLLVATGRWSAAEAALTRAARTLEKGHARLRAEPLARLAQLRVRQGRLEEAAQVLDGFEAHAAATLALAELHLARGQADLATQVLERRLRVVAGDATLAAPLLEALVDARLALGDRPGASAAAARLQALATEMPRPVLEAIALMAAVRVGEGGAAVPPALPQRALEIYSAMGLVFEEARSRLQWARAAGAGDEAAGEARLALEIFDRLGAQPWADAAAALLRSLGAQDLPAPPKKAPLTRRELQVLEVLRNGLSNAEIGERLSISPGTVEQHISGILGKLGLRDRSEAVAWALRQARGSEAG